MEDTVEGACKPLALKVHRNRKFERERAIELLAALGRDAAFLEKKVADLSGGEIQISALVRAIQLDPTILLLDEPTAALDSTTASAVEQLIDRWLTENSDRAMIWVSHNEDQARHVGRRAIRIEAGRLCACQPADFGMRNRFTASLTSTKGSVSDTMQQPIELRAHGSCRRPYR